MTKIFFHPSLLLLILDLGSGIRDGYKSGSGIRDKHLGSATLVLTNNYQIIQGLPIRKKYPDLYKMIVDPDPKQELYPDLTRGTPTVKKY
jgi:hypothetical protein